MKANYVQCCRVRRRTCCGLAHPIRVRAPRVCLNPICSYGHYYNLWREHTYINERFFKKIWMYTHFLLRTFFWATDGSAPVIGIHKSIYIYLPNRSKYYPFARELITHFDVIYFLSERVEIGRPHTHTAYQILHPSRLIYDGYRTYSHIVASIFHAGNIRLWLTAVILCARLCAGYLNWYWLTWLVSAFLYTHTVRYSVFSRSIIRHVNTHQKSHSIQINAPAKVRILFGMSFVSSQPFCTSKTSDNIAPLLTLFSHFSTLPVCCCLLACLCRAHDVRN